ncbi:hypothetical protein EDB85DRAFT_2286015 [Lactarius pseudohatsudake]|nr:hypothetical protein EDB85DRAFT_2286015 [Lactarius pseudohatsudake]
MPLSPPKACRKYVDLINEISGKWVNWNPLNLIEVGDFGQINEETGQFVREGNIYRDEPLASIAKDYPPVVYDPIPEFRIDSGFAPRVHTPPDFGNLSDIVYKCQWQFKNERAAFIVLHRARKISIPNTFLEMTLKNESIREIREKNVVTNVWSSPAFAMYLSNKSGEHVKIALRTTNAGSKETGWYAEGNVGVYQFGSLPNEGYQPLYQLQRIQLRNKQPRRDGRPPGEMFWGVPESPWKGLDDDGEEIPSDHEQWDDGDDDDDDDDDDADDD